MLVIFIQHFTALKVALNPFVFFRLFFGPDTHIALIVEPVDLATTLCLPHIGSEAL